MELIFTKLQEELNELKNPTTERKIFYNSKKN